MDDPLAIYVHWPYCARICPYCDFNVYRNKSNTGLTHSIIQDLEGWRDWSGERSVSSLHFGGGTPSLMSSDDVRAVINSIADLWDVQPDAEIALEANPQDVDVAKWKSYQAAGLNRLSLGVQTFHDPALNMLGRDHDAAQAREALSVAIDIFSSVSLDLIFGWEGQTKDIWQTDMEIAVNSGALHISAYQLTIEKGTAFAKAEDRGEARAVDGDTSADLYDMARHAFTSAGYEHYEASNFAKVGNRSRHNMAYWQGHDYVGVGPGAHGRLTVKGERHGTIAVMRPFDYKAQVQKQGLGVQATEVLSPAARADEYVLMGLRINDGISLLRYKHLAGQFLPEGKMQMLLDAGLLARDGDTLKATPKGRLVLNAVTSELLT